MVIGLSGGIGYLQAGNGRITLGITNPTGSVVIEQEDGAGGWHPVTYDGVEVVLNSNFTVQAIYAPCKIKLTATGTGVYAKG